MSISAGQIELHERDRARPREVSDMIDNGHTYCGAINGVPEQTAFSCSLISASVDWRPSYLQKAIKPRNAHDVLHVPV